MSKDVVIRISKDNHKRMKALMEQTVDMKGRQPTTNQLLDKLLDSMENLSKADMFYAVGKSLFDDLAMARGESIVRAVNLNEVPEWPKIVVVIGSDEGT